MKEVLQITISKAKTPKTKLGKWWYWKVYWKIWKIWRPKLLAKFYGGLSMLMLSLLPKNKREEILKEYENIEIVIKDEINDEKRERNS